MGRAVVLLDRSVHDRNSFSCGVEPLDRYIRERAAVDVEKGVAVCYVLQDDSDASVLVGYYTISNLSIELSSLPEALKKWLPRYPHVPATLIGKLASSSKHREQRNGEYLLLDALRRAYETSHVIGSAVVVVDAMEERVVGFYEKYGFKRVSSGSLRLYLPMATLTGVFSVEQP